MKSVKGMDSEPTPAMTWAKSPQELVDRFHAVLPVDPAVVRRKMFGYPCAFVHGHMFAGVHGAHLILRLPETLFEQLIGLPDAAPFEPMPGRPMKGYALVPAALLADTAAVTTWLERAFTGAAALPPKEPKPRARQVKK